MRKIVWFVAMLAVSGCAHKKPASQNAAARRVESAPGSHPHTITQTFDASATTK